MDEHVAGRAYAQAYRLGRGRTQLYDRLVSAVERSGGQLLYASQADRAPVYLGIQSPRDERIGVLIYPFTANKRVTTNRPSDEHRLQIRYGGQPSWEQREHPVGWDVAGVDTTLVLGVHLHQDFFVGLDPSLYDPLPMGISVYVKQSHVDVVSTDAEGWHVFERNTIEGIRRAPRAEDGLETVVLFRSHRLLDYIRLERTCTDLGLDPALRFATAVEAATPGGADGRAVASTHDLETQFDMTSAQILEMIGRRTRLAVAVRGGVAEHHLYRALTAEDGVRVVTPLDEDGRHDVDVTLDDGRVVSVECKNCSPRRYVNGDIKVEVQKTRATQGDPAGRLYRPDQFEILAACLYAPTGEWRFAYRATALMDRHTAYPDRLAPLHRVTSEWAPTLREAL